MFTLLPKRAIMLAVALSVYAFPAYGAEPGAIVTLRTDLVDSINSIALTSASSSIFWDIGVEPIALHRIDFSIEAFSDHLFVPLAVTRGESETVGLEFEIESRKSEPMSAGTALGILVPHTKTEGALAHISPGETETFSLFVAFTDTPQKDREDRIRVTGLTLGTVGKTAELNRHETDGLVSTFSEFYRPQ